MELLNEAAGTYADASTIPDSAKALRSSAGYLPNDPDVMASKASIYQAEGNLQEAAKLLSQINAQTPSDDCLRNQDHSIET